MSDVSHGYRSATRDERKAGRACEFCRNHKLREMSGRLECPFQDGYQVGKRSICDLWSGVV